MIYLLIFLYNWSDVSFQSVQRYWRHVQNWLVAVLCRDNEFEEGMGWVEN